MINQKDQATHSALARFIALASLTAAFTFGGTAVLSKHSFAQSIDGDTVNISGPSSEALNIQINKGTLIRLKRPASQVFVANPEVADISVKSDTVIYVFGKTHGVTSFYALDEDDNTIYSSNISVTQNLAPLHSALKRMLPNLNVNASIIGNMVVLQGAVESPDQAATAERIARSLAGTDDILNSISVVQPTQVNLRVRIAEVSRSVLKQIGFNWEVFGSAGDFGFGLAQGRNVVDIVADPITGGPLTVFNPGEAPALLGSLATGGLDLNYIIDALDNEGFISTLAEPNLTALTGETANFLAGGEFPVPVPVQNGQIGIQFREFGVRLEFTPTVLNSGRISMRVAPEVSDLTTVGAITLGGISVPAITTRRAQTTVELGSGQSFAIAGLIENNTTQSANKIPGLGDIPILGALFRSDEFQREETELLIVVTPYIVRPVSNRQLALPTDGYVAPDDLERFLKGDLWKPNTVSAITNQDKKSGPSLKKRAGFQLD